MVILNSNIGIEFEFRKKNKHESLKISKKFKHRKNRRSSLIAKHRWHEKRYLSRRDRLDLKHHTQELVTQHINDINDDNKDNINKKNINSSAGSIYKARGGGGPKQKPKSKKLISVCKSESRNQLLKEIKNLDGDLSLRYCSKVSKIIKQCKNKETGKAFLKKLEKKQTCEQSQKCLFFIRNLFLFDELNNNHKKRKRKKRKRKSGNNNNSSKENKKEDENSSDYWRYYNRSRKIKSKARVSKFYRLFFLLTSLSMDRSASRYTVYQMLEAQLDSLMKINNKINDKNKNKNRNNNNNNDNDNDNNDNDVEFSDDEKAQFIELVLYQVFGEINSDFISQVLSYWKEQQQYKKEKKQKYWGWGRRMKNKTSEQTPKIHDTRKEAVSENDTEIHFDNNTISTRELKLRYSVLLTRRNNNNNNNNSVGSTITIDEIGCKVIETSCDFNTVIASKSFNDVSNSVCKLEININKKEKLIGEAVLNLMNINKTNKHGIKLVDNMNNIDSVNVELLNRGWMMNTNRNRNRNRNTNANKFNYFNTDDGERRWKERICIERIYGLCTQMWYLLFNKYYCHDDSGVLIPRFTFKASMFGFNKTKLGEISDILYNLKITDDEDSINSNNNYIPFDVVSLIIVYVGYNKYERIEFDAILDGSHNSNNNNKSLAVNNSQVIKSITLTPDSIYDLFPSDIITETVTTSNVFRYDCDGNNTAGVINKNIFLDDEANVVDWEKDYLATKKVDHYDTDDTSYTGSYGGMFGDDSSSYWSSSSD